MVRYKGIDVSLFQGDIDWERVKADGIEFVMIKASQGRIAEYDAPFTDPRYHEYRRGAGQAGLYHGCYHYLCCRSLEEARQEAEYFAQLVKPYLHEMKLWAAVDVEDNATVGRLDYDTLTEAVRIFCDVVREAGLRPMVYSNTDWMEWSRKFAVPDGVPVWQAHYGREDFPEGARLWQYTGTGRVDGIAGDVDVNIGIDIIGDANGDGKVNLADAGLAMRAAAGWKRTGIDEGQADVDDDGYVTLKDAAEIIKRTTGRR